MNPLDQALAHLANRNLFITGGAGVGKSYLTNEILSHYYATDQNFAALGSTGIAAVNIGGQTVHSFFGFGINKNIEELANADKRNRNLKQIYKTIGAMKLIAIDEISMISSDMMEMIDYRLKNSSFKGRLLFVGDFYQLPPVQKADDKPKNLFSKTMAFESDAWGYFDPFVMELKVSYRTKDREFLQFLDTLRVGKIDEKSKAMLAKLADQKSVLSDDPTYLYGRNLEVDRLNGVNLAKLNSDLVVFDAVIKKHKNCTDKRLESFTKALNTPSRLEIKVGSPVLFTANNKLEDFYNGERGVVVGIDSKEIAIEKTDGSITMLKRHDFTLVDHAYEEPLATVSQFPIRLAWAITIHKSQGMSISPLVVNLDNIFEKGQLYVALSRATSPNTLLIESRYNIENLLKRSVFKNDLVDDFYSKARSD